MSLVINYLFLAIISFGCLWPTATIALPSDNQKPATIDANSALLNQKTNSSTFIGNVVVVEGSTRLYADKLTTYGSKEKKLNKVIAFGKPARYQTIPKAGDKIFYASANEIIYFGTTGKVILIGDGKLKQGSSTFNAPYITYDRKTGIVSSKSNKNHRTTIVIDPKSLPNTNISSNQSTKP